MFMKSLGKPMNAFFSIAYTEEIQPRMTRMNENVKSSLVPESPPSIRVIRVIRGIKIL